MLYSGMARYGSLKKVQSIDRFKKKILWLFSFSLISLFSERKKRCMNYFPNLCCLWPGPYLGHAHSCGSNGEKLTRRRPHKSRWPLVPQTPHIDGAVWQARLPNNSIKQKERQERGAQIEEVEKGREERGRGKQRRPRAGGCQGPIAEPAGDLAGGRAGRDGRHDKTWGQERRSVMC